MATNPYFSQRVTSEQLLYEDIVIEALKFYGQDVYYLPRDIVNLDRILYDDIPSRFNSSYIVEMYIENTEGFDGEGDLFTKFGVEIRDQATFVVARKRWTAAVKNFDTEITGNRPREGDLIYLPLSNSMFQIMHVEHEQPFYQLSNLPTYKLRCEKFEYSGEDFDTNISVIDSIERTGYQQVLTLTDSADNRFVVGNIVTQATADSAVFVVGEIVSYNDSDNQLFVTHVGATNGSFNTFTSGLVITSLDDDSNTLTRLVSAVDEQLNNPTSQNDDFNTETSGIISFDEDNPFGDPS